MNITTSYPAILLSATALFSPVAAFAQVSAPAQSTAQAPTTTATPGTTTTDGALQNGDIIVTAQKRSENIQRVPISVSAFTGATLALNEVNTPADLQRIAPTLRFTSSTGTLGARFSIRGVGTFNNSAIEPSVASFIDGIYIPRPSSIVNSLLDIAAVEVLSGPQGTLFGRNASAGAISYRTGQPTNELSASVRTEYSTGDHSRTEAVVNVPVTDKVAVRVAGLADLFGGYWHNDLTGRRFGGLDTYEGRASVRAELSNALTWTVRGEYQKNTGSGALNYKLDPATTTPATLAKLTALQGGIAPDLNLFSTHNNYDTDHFHIGDSTYGISSDLDLKLGGDFTLRLLDGYYDWNSHQTDGDTANLAIYVLGRDLTYRSKSDSHELQFISPKGRYLDGKFDFVGGLYYFNENLNIINTSVNGDSFCSALVPLASLPFGHIIPGATLADKVATCQGYANPSSTANFNQNTRSLAGYYQATYKLFPKVDVTGGVRYTNDRKQASYVGTVFNPTGLIIAANETDPSLYLNDSRVTYRANVAWRPMQNVMLFGTVSSGFKSGGFNNGGATKVLGEAARSFAAETTTNYEIGIKSQFLDRRVTVNATAFRMDVGNFQERSIVGLISTIRNVGKVRQQGLEFEGVVAPIDHLKFNANITYLDSRITSYLNAPTPPYCPATLAVATVACPVAVGGVQNLSGARLNYNPKWSGVVGAQVDGSIAGGFKWLVNGDTSFTSSQSMGTTIDGSPLLVQRGYSLFNLRLTVTDRSDKYSLAVFGRNITNKGYCAARVYAVLEGPLGSRYDTTGDGVNDGTAIRCSVGAPRVIGIAASAKF